MDNSSMAIGIGSLIYQTLNFLNLIVSIIAASIVIYLFITKRQAISSIYSFFVNYTFQTSLNEIYRKLEELNQYNADDLIHRKKVIGIFNEIIGQMRGNPILTSRCKKILTKLSKYEGNPDLLTDPRKRSLTAELRETLRHINIQSYHELLGGKYE